MIPDFEIPKCPEFKVRSKIKKILKNRNFLEEYSVKFMKLIFIFINIMKKKKKLIIMGANIYYLELIFISVNIL